MAVPGHCKWPKAPFGLCMASGHQCTHALAIVGTLHAHGACHTHGVGNKQTAGKVQVNCKQAAGAPWCAQPQIWPFDDFLIPFFTTTSQPHANKHTNLHSKFQAQSSIRPKKPIVFKQNFGTSLAHAPSQQATFWHPN